MLWSATGRLYLEYAGAVLDTGRDGFYKYNSFTVPEKRREGLFRACVQELQRIYGAAGRKHAYGAISHFNAPSLMATETLGNRVVGESYRFKVFGINFVWVKSWPQPTKKLRMFRRPPDAELRGI